MSEDADRDPRKEAALSRDRVSLTRNPELAAALLDAYPYAETEQEAIRDAMKDAVRRKTECYSDSD